MNLAYDILKLRDQVAAQTDVMRSATTLLLGLDLLLKAALSEASQAGATPEQLASLSALDAAMQDGAMALGAAVANNTPALTPMPAEPAPELAEPEHPALPPPSEPVAERRS